MLARGSGRGVYTKGTKIRAEMSQPAEERTDGGRLQLQTQ